MWKLREEGQRSAEKEGWKQRRKKEWKNKNIAALFLFYLLVPASTPLFGSDINKHMLAH